MNLQEKKQAYNDLKGRKYYDKDRALLEKKSPNSRVLLRNPPNRVNHITVEKVANDILYELLNFATVEEIQNNRLGIQEQAKIDKSQVTGTPPKKKGEALSKSSQKSTGETPKTKKSGLQKQSSTTTVTPSENLSKSKKNSTKSTTSKPLNDSQT